MPHAEIMTAAIVIAILAVIIWLTAVCITHAKNGQSLRSLLHRTLYHVQHRAEISRLECHNSVRCLIHRRLYRPSIRLHALDSPLRVIAQELVFSAYVVAPVALYG